MNERVICRHCGGTGFQQKKPRKTPERQRVPHLVTCVRCEKRVMKFSSEWATTNRLDYCLPCAKEL